MQGFLNSPVCKCMNRGEEKSIFQAEPIFPISASEPRVLETGDRLVLLSYHMGYLGRFFFFFLNLGWFPKATKNTSNPPNSMLYWFKQNVSVTTNIF